ncbi:MAG TPA: 4Fe-4S binding protein [Methanocorpusculum sp.]|nr:4Fe-4S binding protein [Methanocorpusculum sp.]
MKLMVTFDSNAVQEAIIANAILVSEVPVNIERAQIDGDDGWIVLDVKDADAEKFIEALKHPGVVVVVIQQGAVSHNRTECVDCGLCISICPKKVFSFDDSWQLQVNSERCVLCGRCVMYCPQRALSLQR